MSDNQTKLMSEEDAKQVVEFAQGQAHKMFAKLPLLGPVAWLMMQQAHTKHTLLSELEWRVIPPLMHEQCKLFMRNDAPLAFVSWGKFSKEVANRYRTPPHQLSFGDWTSGDDIWVVDVIAPFGGVTHLMNEIRGKMLAGHDINQLAPGKNGVVDAIRWPALPAMATDKAPTE